MFKKENGCDSERADGGRIRNDWLEEEFKF